MADLPQGAQPQTPADYAVQNPQERAFVVWPATRLDNSGFVGSNNPDAYNEWDQTYNPQTGQTAPGYNQFVPSYGAPGPVGYAGNSALAGALNRASMEAAQHPGLPGMKNDVTFDVASNQLYMRRGKQPGAQPSTPVGGSLSGLMED